MLLLSFTYSPSTFPSVIFISRLFPELEYALDDPRGRCRDMTGKGKWGNRNVEIALVAPGELGYVMQLVRQALEYQTGEID